MAMFSPVQPEILATDHEKSNDVMPNPSGRSTPGTGTMPLVRENGILPPVARADVRMRGSFLFSDHFLIT